MPFGDGPDGGRRDAGVVFGNITPGDAKSRRLTGAALKTARREVQAVKRDFAARMTCPVFDGYAYGHVPLSLAIDFGRRAVVTADGQLTYDPVENTKSPSGFLSRAGVCREGVRVKGLKSKE